MNRINCLIVDDDPGALEILESYISSIHFLKLLKKCKNTIEAMEIIEEEKVDLLFLDINIPGFSGIQLLKSIKASPAVIITTAYKEYALEGYEYDIVDFLLKPFDFERFLKAVNKAHNMISRSIRQYIIHPRQQRHIFVKSDYKLIKINVEDILFVEGLKDYIKIYTRNKLILTLMSMTSIEMKLPPDEFIRIHRSYIISLGKIDFISRHRVVIGDKFIPISLPYRDKFYAIIDKSL
ncbi:MAG: response regulator transcription factor [Bacteroidales bacterium]|nr:response regulator transcription factor [Bacteroidales bacterium]